MLVVKSTQRPEILDETIEAVLDTYDQQVGDAEKHFLKVAGVNRDDPAIEAAWQDAIGAIGEMWDAVAVACFQLGQLHAQPGGVIPTDAHKTAMAKRIAV